MLNQTKNDYWDLIITPKRNLLEINWREIWEFKDLLFMLVKRDFITVYKQTIFGPIWYVVQPLLTMLIYIFVFTNIAKIPTDEIPPAIFYLSGIILWNFFSESFSQTSNTFFENSAIFGKVYFPRIIIPLSKVISALIKFIIQFLLFFIIYIYVFIDNTLIKPNHFIIFTPCLLLLMGILGLGAGIIFTSLTTKYRDLKFVINFGIQLFMYATPIIYPMSLLSEKYNTFMFFNPIAHVIESFRFAFLGSGQMTYDGLIYTGIFSIVTFIAGIIIFNRTERNFIDTV